MKLYRFLLGMMLLFCITFCFTACGPKSPTASDNSAVCVYFLNDAGSELVAEPVAVPDVSKKDQIKYLLEQLISPPAGKTSPLSEGTKLLSVTIEDEIAVVDFSKEFYGGKDIDKTLASVAVAKTLCSLDYISGVQILVDGEDALDADGKPIGILRESDLVIDQESTTQKDPDTTFKLYFSNEDSEFLVPERLSIDTSGGDTVEKRIVEALMEGPTESGHFKTIPQEAKLLSVETKDGVCFVNFSKEFVDKHSGGTTAQQLTIYSIVNSLTELSTVERVQFLIEGEKREEFHDMVIIEPMVPNKDLIKE